MATAKETKDVEAIQQRMRDRVGENGDIGFDNIGTNDEVFGRMTSLDISQEFDVPMGQKKGDMMAQALEKVGEERVRFVAGVKSELIDAHQITKGGTPGPAPAPNSKEAQAQGRGNSSSGEGTSDDNSPGRHAS